MIDRETEIERICHAALAREGSARARFLAAACAGDDALRLEVESLLAQEPQAAGFLSTPAAASFATEAIPGDRLMIGRQLGPYAIQERIGAGGMGEVYRAHDTTLGRDVAIKILPSLFTSDSDRLARFQREARVLAALNHPHIGAIFGLEDVHGVPALILELVEGDTLDERLHPGPGRLPRGATATPAGVAPPTARGLPVTEALTIARQIAEALEAAHERGIVHRDLKPANIKITSTGFVKVLDFGLAKAMVGDPSVADLSQSPTITEGTAAGILLGTPAYMSPAQARGKPVDKRADVWAFGCVLYEMLTGRLAFPGDTLSDTIVSILEKEPDWRALPGTTPEGIRRLLRRCLEKDATARLRDIGDARLEIEETLRGRTPVHTPEPPSRTRGWSTRMAWALAGVSTVVAIAVAVLFVGTRQPDARPIRFTLTPPPNTVLGRNVNGNGTFALSPDGRRLAFVTDRPSGGPRFIWVRSLDSLDVMPLTGSDGGEFPFWSPDNHTVAFVAQGKLRAIDVDSRSSRTLCDIRGQINGGAWSPDGNVIVFGMLPGGLFSVPASGGATTSLAHQDATAGETHLFPTFLPDGRRFVYLSVPSNVAWLGSLDAKHAPVQLLQADSQVTYVEPGYLVFVRQSALMAQRFDAQHASLAGGTVPIAEGALEKSGYGAAFATSPNGVLVYRRDRQNVPTQLTWSDRRGKRLGTVGNPGRYRNPELSPDGSSVVMEVLDAESGSADVWRLEVERGVTTRLTSDPNDEIYPTWSPDGASIIFASNRNGGVPQLYRVRANGTGGEQRVYESKTPMLPLSWAPDGRTFVYQSRPDYKFGLLPLMERGVPHRFDNSIAASVQGFAQVSPDGHWLTYGSTEGEREWDIYVQSFPVPGDKYRVSRDRGASPRWSRDGREIFYYAMDGRLMAVPVTPHGSSLEFGATVALFDPALLGGPPPLVPFKQQYDVASDGRFLLNALVEPLSDQSFMVAINWPASLPR